MRVRALTLIVLVAVWMLPGSGLACPSVADGSAEHTHAHSDAAPVHAHDHADHGSDAAHHEEAGAPRSGEQGSPSDDPSCCAGGPDALAVEAALKDAPRPKAATAFLPTMLATATPPAVSVSAAEFRRQPPPPLPFARTRRPLLI